MALTAEEEQKVRDILSVYSQTLDIAAASTDILSALGYGDVRVIDLPPALTLQAQDVFYIAQNGGDVKGSIEQISNFIIDQVLPVLQSQIQASLADNKFYFFGQF